MTRTMRLAALLAIATLLATGCRKQAPMSEKMAGPFQEALDQKRTELEIPGISAAVILPDGTTWRGASGMSSENEAMHPTMLFGLASVTKTYIAALFLQLAEKYGLSVEDSVGRWIPELGQIEGSITIRQLLNHTSGICRFQTKPEYLAAVTSQPERIWTPQEILKEFQGEPACPPGACWGESMMDYVLLGMIIEKATGATVSSLLETRFFTPRELVETFLYPDRKYPAEKMAHMWWDVSGSGKPVDVVDGAGDLPLAGLFSSLWASGAMHSTAENLARFVKDLFEGKILGKDSLKAMLSPGPELYPGANYGFSVIIDRIAGQTAYWHSGGAGYSSIYFYFPDEYLSIAVLSNLMKDPKPIAIALYNIYGERRE
ncbi:MAG: beta-lactamase family protein [Candidatus Aminicenantes bacterium]|nr:beta-lactamase family protein [Candidatus Aminicenantes bacterium]